MRVELYDENVRRPGARFWVVSIVAVTLAVGGGLAANHFLFPSEASELQLETLDIAPAPPAREPTTEAPAEPISQPLAQAESLVATHDSVSGVSISLPATWSARTADDVLLVRADACGSISLVFYPIELVDRTLDASTLLESVSRVLIDQVNSGGGSLTLGTIDAPDDSSATGLLGGTACGTQVEGVAQASVQGARALVKLHWFPTDQKESLANTVNKVLQSYKLKADAEILAYQGDALQLPVPRGWEFTESSESASATSGDQVVTIARLDFPSNETLDTALDSWLQLERDGGRELANLTTEGTDEASLDDAQARRWNTQARHLTYTSAGTEYRATVTAAYTDALGNSALILWSSAPSSKWDEHLGRLGSIASGARVKTGDATLLSLPGHMTPTDTSALTGTQVTEVLRALAAKRWEPQIGGFLLVQSSTGLQFWAPRTARNPSTGAFTTTFEGRLVSLEPVTEEDDAD